VHDNKGNLPRNNYIKNEHEWKNDLPITVIIVIRVHQHFPPLKNTIKHNYENEVSLA
jgi:hypothetical protein